MKYIILDLEWNTAFVKKTGSFLNEIIEVGAVMTDESFNVVDTFTQIIKPKCAKKLSSKVKKLTHIQNSDLECGKPFAQVMASFRKWIGNGDNVICTWGDTDIRTLVDNFKLFTGASHIPFMKKYCNLQAYVQNALSATYQPGLAHVAQELGINVDELELHRALADCSLTVRCVQKLDNRELLASYIHKCNTEFYKKLFFKPKVISDIKNPLVDKKEFYGHCPECDSMLVRQGDWIYKSSFFRAPHICESCDKPYSVNIRFKLLFDDVEIKKRVDLIVPKEPEVIEEAAEEATV